VNDDLIHRVYMQDFYRCEPGYEDQARNVSIAVCKNLLSNLKYEARLQSIVDFYAYQGVKVNKTQARTMFLTAEQYLAVTI
jgi:hypothetical protein